MSAYVTRRVLLLIPTLIGVMLLVFLLTRVAVRGDTVDVLLSSSHSSDTATAQQLRHKLGLDQPWYQQFWSWSWDALHGDLGDSIISAQPISSQLKDRFPQTLELAFLATVFALILSIPVGVLAAVFQDGWPDYILRSVSILLLAIPGFWLATLVVTIGSLHFGYTPPLESTAVTSDPLGSLKQMFMPALLLGLSTGAAVMRMMRTTMLEVLRQDYMRTARAKGLGPRLVIVRHALRNALIPVVTVFGIQVGAVLGGSVIFEQIFAINGVGRYLFESMGNRDFTAIQGITLILASTVIAINLIVDLSYAYLDPRIRYE